MAICNFSAIVSKSFCERVNTGAAALAYLMFFASNLVVGDVMPLGSCSFVFYAGE